MVIKIERKFDLVFISGFTGDANIVPSQKPDMKLTEQTSTLQYFARASGLALLAIHLQVHHPAFNSSTVIHLYRSAVIFFDTLRVCNGFHLMPR